MKIKSQSLRSKANYATFFNFKKTLKYLYLLFDPDHWLFTENEPSLVDVHGHGKCVMDQGGWIFNTEAHPIDPSGKTFFVK